MSYGLKVFGGHKCDSCGSVVETFTTAFNGAVLLCTDCWWKVMRDGSLGPSEDSSPAMLRQIGPEVQTKSGKWITIQLPEDMDHCTLCGAVIEIRNKDDIEKRVCGFCNLDENGDPSEQPETWLLCDDCMEREDVKKED